MATQPSSPADAPRRRSVGCEERSASARAVTPSGPELVEQGQDPDARRLPDPTAYGAHQAGGLDDELAALLLEVAGHRGQDTEDAAMDPPGRDDGTMTRMPTYIAFLRAINVGKRTFRKEAIVRRARPQGAPTSSPTSTPATSG